MSVQKTATILNTASLSDAIDLGGGSLVGLILPAGLNSATVITFQISFDGTSYYNVYDEEGTEYQATITLSSYIALKTLQNLYGADYVKVRTGTNGTPTTQAADVTIECVIKEL